MSQRDASPVRRASPQQQQQPPRLAIEPDIRIEFTPMERGLPKQFANSEAAVQAYRSIPMVLGVEGRKRADDSEPFYSLKVPLDLGIAGKNVNATQASIDAVASDMRASKREHASRLKQLELEHAQKLGDLGRDYGLTVDARVQEQRDQMAQHERDWVAECKAVEQRLRIARISINTTLNAAKEVYETAIREAKETYDAQLKLCLIEEGKTQEAYDAERNRALALRDSSVAAVTQASLDSMAVAKQTHDELLTATQVRFHLARDSLLEDQRLELHVMRTVGREARAFITRILNPTTKQEPDSNNDEQYRDSDELSMRQEEAEAEAERQQQQVAPPVEQPADEQQRQQPAHSSSSDNSRNMSLPRQVPPELLSPHPPTGAPPATPPSEAPVRLVLPLPDAGPAVASLQLSAAQVSSSSVSSSPPIAEPVRRNSPVSHTPVGEPATRRGGRLRRRPGQLANCVSEEADALRLNTQLKGAFHRMLLNFSENACADIENAITALAGDDFFSDVWHQFVKPCWTNVGQIAESPARDWLQFCLQVICPEHYELCSLLGDTRTMSCGMCKREFRPNGARSFSLHFKPVGRTQNVLGAIAESFALDLDNHCAEAVRHVLDLADKLSKALVSLSVLDSTVAATSNWLAVRHALMNLELFIKVNIKPTQ